MVIMKVSHALALLGLLGGALAVPAHPMITPPPSLELARRDFGDDVGSYVGGIFSSFGSGVSSFIASGVPQFFADLPTGTKVLSSLSISDSDLAATPTQALNVPAYANWTDGGWNVRLHGNIFKQPNISQEKLDDLANVFLIDTDIKDLPENQQILARNMTAEIFVVQQSEVNVTITFVNNVEVEPSKDGGSINAAGGAQVIQVPGETTTEGDFDTFVVLLNTTGPNGGKMMGGNETSHVQTLNMYVNGTDTGNATAYLVPPEGVTIVSDIDDILRVTKIYDPKEGLLNSFARPFTPWMNMPDIYANWSRSLNDFHFHYLTTTPEQVTKSYMDFIYKTYPLGSFDTRPLNFSDVSATLAIRKFLLDKIFQTFPKRKFILVGDTSNSDIMKDYPQLDQDFPGQVLCIYLRNTSSTDSSDRFPYDTSGFKNLPQDRYMFFNVPDDLTNLDIVNGHCYNSSVKQNLTFSEQGLPFGLSKNAASATGAPSSWGLGTLVGLIMAAMATGML
ncbi:hypothetical protein GQ53DRAFT_670739 [Thozetella sp. PMI_491]|nr:hypothetical protein GQ53DRAFT_670739 [Thozetella sp. PMI_491]